MSFGLLSPLFLLAALGVAVPIAIHLLPRKKERTVDFPAVRFLLLAQKRSSRRLRLRRLALLLVRCLAVILFALLLARPVLYAPGTVLGAGEAGYTAVILDSSLSMAARTGARTRFEEARSLASSLAAAGGTRERFALVEAAVLPGAGSPPRWLDGAAFLKALEQAAVRPAVADPGRAFAESYRLLREGGAGRRRIFVISDFAPGGWDRFSLASLPVLDPGVPVRLYHLLGGGEGNRAGILRLDSRGESRVAGSPREIGAEIRNLGVDALVPVELWIDGTLAATRLQDVPRGTVTRAVFAVRPTEGGPRRCEVRLPRDAYPEDDRRFLGLDVIPPVGVLLVDGDMGASLAESATFFLGEALRPERLAATLPLEVATVGPEVLERPFAETPEVVVLAALRAPTETAARRLAEFVSAGGGLVVFWGRNGDADLWRSGLAGLLPAPVLGTEETGAEQPWRVGETDAEAPPLALFRPPAGGTLATSAFTARAVVGAPAPAAHVLARFADGMPWIVEQQVGKGRVVFFSSAADLSGNDLVTKPAFVPLVQRTVLWLAGSLDAAADAELIAGAEKIFTAGSELSGTRIEVETPGGARRDAELRPAVAGSRAAFRDTGEIGFYRWSRPGAEGLFAVNVPPEESELEPLDAAELDERFRPVRPEVLRLSPGSSAGAVSRLGVRSAARPVLWVLLLLVLLESLIAGPRRIFPALFSRARSTDGA